MMTIAASVAELVKSDSTMTNEFNDNLLNIQSLLGQTAGDIAGVYFSDEEEWETLTIQGRTDIVQAYIKAEISALLEG